MTLFLRTLHWMQTERLISHDKSVTENTRVSYPINHIEKIVRPVSSAPAAKNVIFLSADAFGVLPPVSILTPEQTQYYFLSGFTAKLAGTERGITEPTPTFSACFGQAFLELHPTKYAEELVKKMEEERSKSIPCKHRMERNRKTYLYQRYTWYHRCDPERCYLKRSDKDRSHTSTLKFRQSFRV